MSQSCFHRMPLVRCVLTVGLVATLMACSDGQNGNRNDDAGGVTTDRAATTTSSASSKPKPGTGAFASRCWSADVPPTSSSSPEATDLNGDGVLDVVVGADGDAGVIAVDGKDGSVLWVAGRQNDVYTAAAFLDANGDGVDDVVMGGRSNDLIAHDGTSGEELWSLRRSLPDLPELWIGTARTIPDLDGDGVRDVLAPQSGSQTDELRLGAIHVVSGATGEQLSVIPMPGDREIYSPPEVEASVPLNEQSLIVGTGGETLPGGVTALRRQADGTVNTEWSADGTGVVAAPVRTTNPAGEQRIIAATWNGPVRMFDGTGKQLWESEDTSLSSAARPVLVADDDRPGGVVIAVQVNGDTYPPVGSDSVIVWLDADTGATLHQVQLDGFSGADPVVFDVDGDGSQELIVAPVQIDREGKGSGQLLALDVVSGETKASAPLDGVTVSTPLIADLDGDGRAQLVYSNGAGLSCLQLAAAVEPGTIVRSYQGAKGPSAKPA
jgi:outer membrane protein assembly factor BamB